MKSYSEIVWPADLAEARKHLLGFFLASLRPYRESLFVENSQNAAFEICHQFFKDEIDLEAYDSSTDVWWEFLAATDGLRAPKNRGHAVARVALCILSVSCDEPLEDQLSWFLEAIYDLDKAIYKKINKAVDDWFVFSE